MKAKTKKIWLIVAIVIEVILVAYIIIGFLPRPQNYALENYMMKEGTLPLFIAHGGGNEEFPDNTFEAFCNAYSIDPDVMLETDVSLTADSVLILSHDVTLDRKTNVTGRIADWKYSDLIAQKVDFGYRNDANTESVDGEVHLKEGAARIKYVSDHGNGIEVKPTDVEYPSSISPDGGVPEWRDGEVFLATTLEDLLEYFPNNRINVEIKQAGEQGKKAFAEALRLLEKYDAFDRVVLASFHDEIYEEFIKYQKTDTADEKFMYSPGTGGATKFFIMQMLCVDVFFGDGITVLQLPMSQLGFDLATQSLVDKAHSHNIAVHYWTIDDEDEMRDLIRIGADGIMTNYPHRLKSVYDAHDDPADV